MSNCSDICRPKKYSEDELRDFKANVENVLKHKECLQEYRQYLSDFERLDLLRFVDIWCLINDMIENRPATPERVSKEDQLKAMLKISAKLRNIYKKDASGKTLRQEVTNLLVNNHVKFVDYLFSEHK